MTQPTWARALRRLPFYLVVVLIAAYALLPFVWAISTSLKSESELFGPATLIPRDPTFRHYVNVLGSATFMRSLSNSVIVAGGSAIIALAAGSFAAYALGRLRFRGKVAMLYAVLAMTMFPQISVLSGLYTNVRELGIFGTQAALLYAYPLFTLPFAAWVLTSFFRGLPREIEEAAVVDGATTGQIFVRILLPLTVPALVTTGLLTFIVSWNEYLFALSFTITSPRAQTVPVAIAQFAGVVEQQEPIAEIMAAAMVVTLPLVILVLVFQQRIAAGLTAGSVKG
ncbi:MAG: carbohydrate ABC transporter permease [Trueperaceae bacterium]|nr:MAG: carbohydrate ABC transporter permease [Trueperaceae bacterium]